MGEKLKTQTVSFKGLFDSNEQDTYLPPEKRYENLTTRQINATELVVSPTSEQTEVKEQNSKKASVLKNTNVEKINPYYSYMPKFYKAEIGHARFGFIFALFLFLIVVVGSAVLSAFTVTTWKDSVNPWILFLLLIPFIIVTILLVINTNRYRSFLQEAKSINFRDEKVLSINVQKLYRRLKTSWIDITWFSCMIYVLMLLGILVDAIVVIFARDIAGVGGDHLAFADFWAAKDLPGGYTYVTCFWVFVTLFGLVAINHILTCIGNYLRASNIDNYYNFSIVDPAELTEIKKRKNKRDLSIFFSIIGTIIFLVWLSLHLVLKKRSAKAQTTVQI